MQTASAKKPAPVLTIAIVSATALGYEILLTRLFAIIQYHHFAYMIISLALLGYGISGTLLSLYQTVLKHHYAQVFLGNIILFSVSSIICYLIAQHIAFNAEEILWDVGQSLRLMCIYLLFMLPFLFAANAIGLSLMTFGEHIGKLYSADLLGAGIGSMIIIGLLFLVLPNHALPFLSAAGMIAAATACWELKCCRRKTMMMLLAIAGILCILPESWLTLSISPYKGLPQLLRIQYTRIIDTKSSPLGLIQVVDSPDIPLRYAPGLSLNATTEPPAQLAVFIDGDGMSAINRKTDNKTSLAFLDQQTSAVLYHLKKPSQLLVLGAGTGNDILQARYHNVSHIDAVELNPQIAELMTKDFSDYSGNIFTQPGIKLHIQDARGYLHTTDNQYDAIQIALLESQSASASGLYALSENYLYTVEAIQEYIAHLKPNGYLSITRWIKLPPRDSLKLFATVIRALRDTGVNNAEQRMMLIRSWQTGTLIIKNGVVTSQEIEQLRKFCAERYFDTAYFPGIDVSQTNEYNVIREPLFYQATHALLGSDADKFLEHYQFNLSPSSDNQPYFFNFFKWQLLPEIIKLKDKGGMPLVEWGYIILILTLLQAILASFVLILLPLFVDHGKVIRRTSQTAMIMLYFTALGLGFMFIEIAFMQKFILFLQHPLYSIAVILAAFLLFAGWGSNVSRQWRHDWGYSKSIKVSVTTIVATGIVYSLLLDSMLSLAIAWPAVLKIIITACLIAPLAFAMGIPFPLALNYLDEHYPKLIPWVWGVNGCASVISAVLAMILAIHFGFNFIIITALALYGGALLVFMQLNKQTIHQFTPT